jgi:two-component system chemotaxis response regulator CheY
MKVLIVDDSRAMRIIVARTLRLAGWDTLDIAEASSGADAVDKLVDPLPDLVLSDWNMPHMSGLELLEWLRERGFRGVFAFVTSEATERMRAQALSAGASAYLTKPFSPESFRAALGAVLPA